MATVTSVGDGDWSAGGTWDSDPAIPVNGDTVVIDVGDTVTFDVDQSGFAAGITLTCNGELVCTTDAGDYYLKLGGGNMTGTGTVKAGTVDTALPSTVTFTIATNGVQITGSSTGPFFELYCTAPTYRYVKTTQIYNSGDSSFAIDTDISGDIWAVGDSICFAEPGSFDPEHEVIDSFPDGTTIDIVGTINSTYASGSWIGLLTRNIRMINLSTSAYMIYRAQYCHFGCEMYHYDNRSVYEPRYCAFGPEGTGWSSSSDAAWCYVAYYCNFSGLYYAYWITCIQSPILCCLENAVVMGARYGIYYPYHIEIDNSELIGCDETIVQGYGGSTIRGGTISGATGLRYSRGNTRIYGTEFNNGVNDLEDMWVLGSITGYGVTLDGTTQVEQFYHGSSPTDTARKAGGFHTITMYDIGGVKGDLKVWNAGGTVATEAVAIGPLSKNHKMSFTDQDYGLVQDDPQDTNWYDIPILVPADSTVKIDVWMTKDTNSMNVTPRCQIVDLADDPLWITGGTALDTQTMVDDTNEQRFLLSYTTGTAPENVVLRFYGSHTAGTCKTGHIINIHKKRDLIYDPISDTINQ